MLPAAIEAEALDLLVDLVRIDTTNPPGNERACADLVARFLAQDGYEPVVIESAAGRANVVARRKGAGEGGGPLLLTGHLDVVPAEPEGWKHPPFGGVIDAGWLYGRGAVDMKNHVAACASIMRQLAREKVALKRDVIFAAVADEEAGCGQGAEFLVERHPDLVRAEYAIGEVGGFTLKVGRQRLYPIQIAHKGATWLSMKARGTSGHGSMPREDNALLKLSRALMRIGNLKLPVHPTEPAARMLEAFGAARGFPASALLSLLTRPALTDFVLETFVSELAVRRTFSAVLRNTVTPTVLKAGGATNVIPGVAEAHLDGRILPGQTTAHLLRELADVIDDPAIELEVLREIRPVESPMDTPLYRALADAVKVMDPAGVPIPYILPGFTDASAFSRLGTRWYGFAPVVLPDDPPVVFSELFHGRDERIPVEGFKQGLQALWSAVRAFCG